MQLCAILLSPIGLLATLLAPMAWPPRRVSRLEPSFAESTTVGSISPFENANDNLLDSSVLHKAAAATESAALRPIVFENADDSILDSIILYGSSSAVGSPAAHHLRLEYLIGRRRVGSRLHNSASNFFLVGSTVRSKALDQVDRVHGFKRVARTQLV
jgi:hypothetical protein